jgi:RNA polymerase sigma factor (TIGR02999 family)
MPDPDRKAAEELFPLVYDELRKLAESRMRSEGAGHTLQPTALVHEAYLRLVGSDQPWNGRGHFFAAASEAMRRLLINRARDRGRLKRGGERGRVELVDLADAAAAPPDVLLDLDGALDRLGAAYPRCADLVKLRFYAGLAQREAARALGVSRSAADRDWAFARAWLFRALSAD